MDLKRKVLVWMLLVTFALFFIGAIIFFIKVGPKNLFKELTTSEQQRFRCFIDFIESKGMKVEFFANQDFEKGFSFKVYTQKNNFVTVDYYKEELKPWEYTRSTSGMIRKTRHVHPTMLRIRASSFNEGLLTLLVYTNIDKVQKALMTNLDMYPDAKRYSLIPLKESDKAGAAIFLALNQQTQLPDFSLLEEQDRNIVLGYFERAKLVGAKVHMPSIFLKGSQDEMNYIVKLVNKISTL